MITGVNIVMYKFRTRVESILEENYTGFLLTESRQFPVSVRTPAYKKLEDKLFFDIASKAAAQDLWSKVSMDPSAGGIEKFVNINNSHGKWYKFKLRISGRQGDYRFLAFEPNDCPGLLIWDWVGSHEEYNKIWKNKIGTVPSGWLDQRGRVRSPYLTHACLAATDARGKGLPMPEPQIQKKAAIAARPHKKQIQYKHSSYKLDRQKQ